MSKAKTSIHKVQTSLVSRTRPATTMNYWVPNADIFITDNTLVVQVELAGISRENLELVIDETRLLITGHRPDGCRDGKCNFIAMEINYGSFECNIDIPPGYDTSQAQAAYNNGFLRVDIPSASMRRPSSSNSADQE